MSSPRLDRQEALELLLHADLLELGERAHARRLELHPEPEVTFAIDRNINYTNICECQCRFCAYYRRPEEADAFVIAPETLREKIKETLALGGTQILLQGGLNPELDIDYYVALLENIRAEFPTIHIHGFSPPEICHIAKLSRLTISEVITRLQAAGLGSIPGGGAEILDATIRNQICPEKISGERWLEVIEQVHNAGLKSNATMLFGHLENGADRVDHMSRLRALQDRTGGFQSFIPLAFQPDNTRVLGAKGVGGVDALKTLAISRIYLDNFQHVKAYWVMLGMKIAQTSLCFGVNDLDGTVIEEQIGHDAGADSPQELGKDRIINLIRAAGKTPVERDTLYNELKVY
jgi:aminodeoxyfutalosine synthase